MYNCNSVHTILSLSQIQQWQQGSGFVTFWVVSNDLIGTLEKAIDDYIKIKTH